jgi:hypothetical protein
VHRNSTYFFAVLLAAAAIDGVASAQRNHTKAPVVRIVGPDPIKARLDLWRKVWSQDR